MQRHAAILQVATTQCSPHEDHRTLTCAQGSAARLCSNCSSCHIQVMMIRGVYAWLNCCAVGDLPGSQLMIRLLHGCFCDVTVAGGGQSLGF